MKRFIMCIFSCILFFTPIMKGLYFEADFYPIHLLIQAVFLLTILYVLLTQKSIYFGYSWLLLIFPLVLSITLFVAESPKGTLDEILRWMTYSIFFLLLYWSSTDEKMKKFLLPVLQATGIFIGVHGVLGYKGIVEFEGVISNGRLGGFFQYPNTMGIVMSAFFLFSLVMLLENDRGKKHYLYSVPLALYSTSILATGSRGALLVLGIVWMLSIFFLKSKKQIDYIVYTALATIAGLVGFITIEKVEGIISIVCLFAILLLTTLLIYLVKKPLENLEGKWISHKKSWIIPSIISLSFVLLILDLLNKGLIFSILPSQLQARIQGLETLTERTIIAKDAWGAFLQSPLLGYGAEGWSVIFTQFQSLPYQTKNLHNGYVEWLIQAGIIGFLAFILVFLFYIVIIMKNWRAKQGYQYLAVIVALLVLFIHSFIDFNFSFGTVWMIILWFIIVGLDPSSKVKRAERDIKKVASIAAISVSVLIGGFFTYRYISSNQVYEQAINTRAPEDQLYYVTKSVELDSTNIEKWNALGIVYIDLYNMSKSEQYRSKVESIVTKMLELEPKSTIVKEYSINLLKQAGLNNKALPIVETALKFDHYNNSLYAHSIQMNTDIALKQLKNGNENEALIAAKSGIASFHTMNEWEEKFHRAVPEDERSDFNSREFKTTEELTYLTALSHFLIGEFEMALDLTTNLTLDNEELALKVNALRLVCFEKIQSKEQVEDLLKNYESMEEFDQIYEELQKQPIIQD